MKKSILSLVLAALTAPCTLLSAKKLSIGDKAPDFTLKDEKNDDVTLSSFQGKKVAIYFYPKDSTPGCTKQACSLRDGFADLKEQGIVVLGISYDSPKSHKKFKEKHNLQFTLLSDAKKQVAKRYNAKGGFLMISMPKRVTYLVDEQGVIVNIIKDIDVKNHADQIKKGFTQTS